MLRIDFVEWIRMTIRLTDVGQDVPLVVIPAGLWQGSLEKNTDGFPINNVGNDDQGDEFPITTIGKDRSCSSSPQVGGGDPSEKHLANP